jgi:hypothetical protein
VEKLTWTLARGDERDRDRFTAWLRDDLADAVSTRVRSLSCAHVTVQDGDAYSRSAVATRDGDREVDAVLEIETSDSFTALDGFRSYLASHCAHIQGWRVHPTMIFDVSTAPPLLEPSSATQVMVFLERLDGSTPEHFSRNWYVHAGHLDGEEAESEASRVERARDEDAGFCTRYVQNRVIEPITPTAWVLHGYTQLFLPLLVPEEAAIVPYARDRGEQPFEKWPPRYVQGPELRIA